MDTKSRRSRRRGAHCCFPVSVGMLSSPCCLVAWNVRHHVAGIFVMTGQNMHKGTSQSVARSDTAKHESTSRLSDDGAEHIATRESKHSTRR